MPNKPQNQPIRLQLPVILRVLAVTCVIAPLTASDVETGLGARIHNAIGPCVGIGVALDEYYVAAVHAGMFGAQMRAGIGYMMHPKNESTWNWFSIEQSLSASVIYKYKDTWDGDKDTLYFGGQLKYPLLPGLGSILPINVDVGAYTEYKFDQFLLTASIGYGF